MVETQRREYLRGELMNEVRKPLRLSVMSFADD